MLRFLNNGIIQMLIQSKAIVLLVCHQIDNFISFAVRNILLQTAGMKSEKESILDGDDDDAHSAN